MTTQFPSPMAVPLQVCYYNSHLETCKPGSNRYNKGQKFPSMSDSDYFTSTKIFEHGFHTGLHIYQIWAKTATVSNYVTKANKKWPVTYKAGPTTNLHQIGVGSKECIGALKL